MKTLVITLFLLKTLPTFGQSDMYRYSVSCDRADVIDTVENFMSHVQLAIATNDKKWLSRNIKYPISVYLEGKTPTTIRTAEQFNQDFDKIFYKAYVQIIKKKVPKEMFSNSQGVMLGDGEIWINTMPSSKSRQCELRIISFNNQLN